MPFTSRTTYTGFGSTAPHYGYVPKDDITAPELARLLPILFASWKNANQHAIMNPSPIEEWLNPAVEALPKSVKRHFERRGDWE